MRIHGTFIVLTHWEKYATDTMTSFLTQSKYPDTDLTSPCPMFVLRRVSLGSDMYQVFMSGIKPGIKSRESNFRMEILHFTNLATTSSV